jgi:hypothetical protein
MHDVPIGISTFDDLTLENKKISSLTELANFVPNLALIGQGVASSTAPVMRGINDKRHWYGKGLVNWKPSDTLSIQFIMSQIQYENTGTNMGLSDVGAAAFGLSASGDRVVYSGLATEENSNSNTQSLKISYDLGETLNLTSITAHRNFQEDFTCCWISAGSLGIWHNYR